MTVLIESAEASRALTGWLVKVGLPQLAGKSVADHVVAAEVVGRSSHGLRLVPRIARIAQSAKRGGSRVSIEERESGSITIDAHGLPGIHALDRAVDVALGHHRSGRGTLTTAVTGFNGSTGCLGLFAHRLAVNGVTSAVMATSRSIMAPPGTLTPIVGTNAIAFGARAEDRPPIVGDFATSSWSYGQVALARERGERLPPGVVLDQSGCPSTDPEAVVHGSLVPSGGHKGWMVALLVEVLAGAMVGGKVGHGPGGESVLLLSSKSGAFSEGSDRAIAALVEQIASAVPTSAGAAPHVPGSRFNRLNGSATTIEVDERTLDRILSAGGPSFSV